MLDRIALLLAVACLVMSNVGLRAADDLTKQPGYVLGEFIYEDAPFPQCHASTIEETKDGLIAAWFGGTREKDPDVGIWVSRWSDGKWSTPVEVANGVISPEKRHPTWNPVLFQPKTGPLLLFYKNGPSPSTWWGELIRSNDGGKTWSKMERLPDGIYGPIKNKPIQLADGTIVSGVSTEHDGWRVHMELSTDNGKTWTATEALNTKDEMDAIQPGLLTFGKTIRILCRSRQGQIATATSDDGGKSWSKMSLIDLPNPNSGIDAVTLKDGRGLLVYNHTKRGRSPLNIAVTKNGTDWKQVVTLENEPGEYSYPAIIQTSDGKVHVTYTWKRQRVKHVVLDASAW